MPNYTPPGMVGGVRPGSFEQRMRELSDRVGKGKIQTKIKFDQAYAARQERTERYAHPRGGKAHFLRDAFFAEHKSHIQRVAYELFRGSVQTLYIRFGESTNEKASANAPLELGNLRRSGSVKVLVGGRAIYTRPASQRRLTRRELNDRVRARHFDQLKGRFNASRRRS